MRNLPVFARFLSIAAMYHGQALNVANIAREAGVARTMVVGFLDILEETLLCFRIPGFEPKLRVRERKHPKVAQLLRAYRDYSDLCDEISYWSAERHSTEVGFILTRGDEHIAIEVKSGATFADRWCRGLRVMASLPGLSRRIIVYPRGPRLETEDGIEVVPFAVLAEMLAAGGP